jgi:hypothetical protein
MKKMVKELLVLPILEFVYWRNQNNQSLFSKNGILVSSMFFCFDYLETSET